MAENQNGEKTEEPTPRKKEQARKQGTIAKSQDLGGSLTLLAVVGIMPAIIGIVGVQLMDALQKGFANLPTGVSQGEIVSFTLHFLRPAALLFAAVAATAMVVGLFANYLQVGFLLTAEPLNPKFQKVNPIEGFKRIFSQRALAEGLKTLLKGMVFGWMAYDAIRQNWSEIIRLSWVDPAAAAGQVGQLLWVIAMRIGGVWLAIAAADYLFQKKQTHKQLMMTKDELKREMKEQEGSPEIKMARMARMRKMSRGRMAEAVKTADAIITNPTHFAVAIKYDRSEMHAPMVVAKGMDYLALKIREIATENKVPIVPNPPLARALYKKCEVGDFIPRDMFSAVAEVLAYVYRTIKTMR